ncbi:MAG: FGGY family carbohydrate kinase [Bauldia litoralis]
MSSVRSDGIDGAGEPVLIGIDAGTTSIRAIAFDQRGRKVAVGARPTPMRVVETGGEYDPDEIWGLVVEALSEVGATLGGRPVAGIAVASVGESPVLIGDDGQSLAPSLVWYDRRTEPLVEQIVAWVSEDRIFGISGHAVQHYYTLPKLIWMRAHWPEEMAKARHVLMMADWIAYRLSGEMATDPSLASRTLYFDIAARRWSAEMLALADVDTDFPAPVAASGTALGRLRDDVAAATGLAGSPMIGVGGHDHVVGGFAVGLREPGTMIDSMGTAEAMMLANAAPLSDPEMLNRGFYQGAIGADRTMSYLGAGIFSSGGAMEWLRSIVGGIPVETLIAEAATIPPGCHGVAFLADLGGLSPPEPDPYARGAFVGMTPQTTPAALYRAVLEGLAMQSRMIFDGMVSLPGVETPRELRLIGGVSRNRLFLSIKASVLDRPIIVVEEPEATALGAALLGGIAGGVFPSLDSALAGLDRTEFVVEPGADTGQYGQLRAMVFEGLHARMRPINRSLHAYLGGLEAR